MELLNSTSETVTRKTYTIKLDDDTVVVRVEMVDENRDVIDSVTRTKDGYSIDGEDDAPIIFEAINHFLDNLEV